MLLYFWSISTLVFFDWVCVFCCWLLPGGEPLPFPTPFLWFQKRQQRNLRKKSLAQSHESCHFQRKTPQVISPDGSPLISLYYPWMLWPSSVPVLPMSSPWPCYVSFEACAYCAWYEWWVEHICWRNISQDQSLWELWHQLPGSNVQFGFLWGSSKGRNIITRFISKEVFWKGEFEKENKKRSDVIWSSGIWVFIIGHLGMFGKKSPSNLMRNMENLGEMGPGMMSKKPWVVNLKAECMLMFEWS